MKSLGVAGWMQVCGAVSITAGAFIMAVPVGFIVAGVFAILFGLAFENGED